MKIYPIINIFNKSMSLTLIFVFRANYQLFKAIYNTKSFSFWEISVFSHIILRALMSGFASYRPACNCATKWSVAGKYHRAVGIILKKKWHQPCDDLESHQKSSEFIEKKLWSRRFCQFESSWKWEKNIHYL